MTRSLALLACLFVAASSLSPLGFAQCVPDDVLEDNDSCASAAVVGSGLFEGLRVAGSDLDHFAIVLQPDEQALVDLIYDPGQGLVDLSAFRPDTVCSVEEPALALEAGLSRTYYFNGDVVPRTFVVRVARALESCADYSLSVTVEQNPCTTGLDDAYETNLGCVAPVALVPGSYPDLYVHETNPDWYLFTVESKERISLSLDYARVVNLNSVVFLSPSLYFEGCGSQPTGVTVSGDRLQWTNFGDEAVDVVYFVSVVGYTCSLYDLTVEIEPDPCLVHSLEDALDDNDDCATATPIPITGAAHQGLFLTKLDDDFYTFTLPAGARVWANLLFDSDAHDIDVELYDDLSSVGAACGGVGPGDAVRSGQPNEEGKWFTWPNVSSSAVTCYMRVHSDDNGANSFCGNYDLILDFDFTSDAIGSRACVGDGTPVPCGCLNHVQSETEEGCKNSTSVGARIEFTGSAVLFDNDVTAHLVQAPPGKMAILLQGDTLVHEPFRDGVKCVGGWTYRLEAAAIDGSGAASSTVPLRTAGDLNPGHDRIYQWWYRDPAFSPCGTGSNFSSGMRVQWL